MSNKGSDLFLKGRVRTSERTILIEGGFSARLSASEPAKRAQATPSWSRLDYLYQVTKLLVNFDSPENTVGEILSIVSGTLPLRSALLIDETAGLAHIHVWNADGTSDRQAKATRSHALAVYAYMAGSSPKLETAEPGSAATRELPVNLYLEKDRNGDKKCSVVIPMVVERRPIFGAFQLVSSTVLSEDDLKFVNAIANQLAIALDRHKVSRQEAAARAKADDARQQLRFLVDASKVLSASLDYDGIWETLARLAVPKIADCCIVDTLDSSLLRRTIVISPFSPPGLFQQNLDGVMKGVADYVLKTRRAVIHPKRGGAELGDAAGQIAAEMSYVCVPLVHNERVLGALTLVSARWSRRYEPSDLILLEDLSRQAAMAFANAELYGSALNAIRCRDDMMHAVSHDLKGPLNVVMGFVGLFLSRDATAEALLCDRKQLEAVQRSAKQMSVLIDDLLDTASIQERHFSVERAMCPLAPLVLEALDLPHALAASSGLQIHSDIPSDLPSIPIDRQRILQVLTNLIGNAIKFTPPGGTVVVRAAVACDDVILSVEDTGTGIAPDEIPHVFDRFWQARKTARLGTGLGLFIVKSIVEAHGGRVWVQSKINAGSKFYVSLPQRDSTQPDR